METIKEAFGVYQKLVNESLQAAVVSGAGIITKKRGIFSAAVVVWLMIFQRLNRDGSLAAAVEHLRSGELDSLLEDGSLPAQTRRISGFTGGFSRARERISLELVEKTVDGINGALDKCHHKSDCMGLKVFVLDGTTIRIAYTPENIETYPQIRNQYGKAHFPLMLVSVATNAITGVALRPAYGPYKGQEATNELDLSKELLTRIPTGSVIIGDRMYGCCRFAYMTQQAGHQVVVRIKEKNAKKFIGTVSGSGEETIAWESSRSKTGETYTVTGRFIWHNFRRKGYRPQRLVLFTTLSLPRQKIIKLYALRWNVELDLRDIKSTLNMDMLYSKTPTMGSKELVLCIAAYNLVRHLVVMSAKTLKVSPRELSFSRALKRVLASSSAICSFTDLEQAQHAIKSIFTDLKCLKIPKRKTKRHQEPRKVWQKGAVCFMTRSREIERAELKNSNKIKILSEK